MTYVPADDRYEHLRYRRSGRSDLQLPAGSLARKAVAEISSRARAVVRAASSSRAFTFSTSAMRRSSVLTFSPRLLTSCAINS
jgi:hypothetical protein